MTKSSTSASRAAGVPAAANPIPVSPASLILMGAKQVAESVVAGSWAKETAKVLRTRLVRALNAAGFELQGRDCCEILRDDDNELVVVAWRDFQDPSSDGVLQVRCVFTASSVAQEFGQTRAFWDVLRLVNDKRLYGHPSPFYSVKTAPRIPVAKNRLAQHEVYASSVIEHEELAKAAQLRLRAPEILQAWTRNAFEQVDSRTLDRALEVMIQRLHTALAP
jgi:hypothetical protein